MSGALIRILLFLLPFLLYGLWLAVIRSKVREDGSLDPRLERRITIGGAVMLVLFAIGATLYLLQEPQAGRDAGYTPPRIENGRILPGGFQEPGETAPDKDDNGQDDDRDRPDNG